MKKKLLFVAAIAGASVLTSCGGGMSEAEVEASMKESLESAFDKFEEEINEDPVIFNSEEGAFNIDFFGVEPKKSVQNAPSEVGELEFTMYMYEKSATEAYMVSFNDYPEELMEGSDIDEMLAGGKDGALTNMGITKAETEEEIEIDGHKGLAFTGNNGNYYASWRVYLVGNRLYQVAALGQGEYAPSENVDQFMESFELVSEETDEDAE